MGKKIYCHSAASTASNKFSLASNNAERKNMKSGNAHYNFHFEVI
jgi:hypothetical protein